jgi:hypothetical protein
VRKICCTCLTRGNNKETMSACKELEIRLKKVEEAVERIASQFKMIELLESRVTECEKKCKEDGISVLNRVILRDGTSQSSKSDEELYSSIAVTEITNAEKIVKLESQIKELGDQALALGLRIEDIKTEYPTPMEAKTSGSKTVTSKSHSKGRNKQCVEIRKNESDSTSTGKRCEEILKNTKESVLLVGDSMARGVGDKLRAQSGKVFDRVSRGGARIETISNEIRKLEDDDKRHLVVIAGTNNLESDTIKEMEDEYKMLLSTLATVKNRKVTVVGVLKRHDLSIGFESKRILVNMMLKGMCQKKEVGFLGYDPEKRQLAKDRLHLNEEGQNDFANRIFKHCVPFLQ